jgi:hypothetical protein
MPKRKYHTEEARIEANRKRTRERMRQIRYVRNREFRPLTRHKSDVELACQRILREALLD